MNKDIVTINEEMRNEKKRLRELEKAEIELGNKHLLFEVEYEKEFARILSTMDGVAANKADKLTRGATADLRYEWKLAEIVYKANIRAQSNCQSIINMLQSQLKYME